MKYAREPKELVPLLEMIQLQKGSREHNIYHKDLLPVVFVTGDMGGEVDSPLYGMFAISEELKNNSGLSQWFINQPDNPYEYSLKWDGEWHITYEVFRDLGLAFAAVLVLIYILLVVQFRSLSQPLLIILAIPMALIGALTGLAVMGQPLGFMALLGMISLIGIVVNDSIVLLDYINTLRRRGLELDDAVLKGASTRLRAITLTSVTTIGGLLPLSLAVYNLWGRLGLSWVRRQIRDDD